MRIKHKKLKPDVDLRRKAWMKPEPEEEQDTLDTLDFEDMSILEPDENDLVREWHRQPKLFFEHARMLAKSRGDLDRAEAELKVVKAEIDRKIRDNPTEYNLAEKPTEASITSTVFLQKEHKRAQSKVIGLQERVNLLYGLVQALDHRKAALENMVKLHGQSYFATPVAKAEDQGFIAEQRKRNIRSKKDNR